MASEARLYTFSQETTTQLRKFRLGTSRSKDPQAMIYRINKATNVIEADEDGTVYTKLNDIEDVLPDHTPRFILLSYPMQLDSGRLSVPYVMINYLPQTTSSEMRMLYAGAKELMRNQSEVGKVINIEEAEEILNIEEKLKSDDS